MTITIAAALPVADTTTAVQQGGAAPASGAAEQQRFQEVIQLQLGASPASAARIADPSALSGEMLNQLRGFVERAHRSDVWLHQVMTRSSSSGEATAYKASLHPGPALQAFDGVQNELGGALTPAGGALTPDGEALTPENVSALTDRVMGELQQSMVLNIWKSLVAHFATEIPRSVRTLLQSQ